ncbi:LPS export ABC transporter periplasmic protein LptC [Campylobacter sp. MIT 99-7217]|uniref:LPS export ABC transporter periplasmic protein LptC n=1 Tax=Campylobacter sp. MIT 99-7217 TaxID=535091 RepID=UPI00115BB007|nr:LPS export ABC transporter periplasmic protein LptC [Campylobacter sp. MIT 99-7217]TQR31904.1 LPS export ABC transporter periplasmic protein LptC [Campylobacter sp. MIT 99-7217]
MAIKIFSVAMGFFALALVYLSLQDLYSLDIKPSAIDFKNIQARDVTLYELNSSSLNTNYKAREWVRYKHKDILSDFILLNTDYNISSNEVELLQDDIILLQGDVLYTDINDTKITTQALSFDNKNKILSTEFEFFITRKDNKIQGQSLKYDLANKELRAEGAKAWLHVD